MPKRILIIANEDAVVRATSEQLTARGHTVDTTPDGSDGFQRARGSPPELVVLQVDLGHGQNGYLLCGKRLAARTLSALEFLTPSLGCGEDACHRVPAKDRPRPCAKDRDGEVSEEGRRNAGAQVEREACSNL
jgi:hypothetical protein